MIYFKACPTCRGDMYFQRDHYGLYKYWIESGLILERSVRRMVPKKVEQAAQDLPEPRG